MFSGWGGSDRGASSQNDEGASLTSILNTPALRTDLVLLIAVISDYQRRNLLANFDVSTPVLRSSPLSEQTSTNPDRKREARARLEQARRQREADLSTPRMQQLRKEAFANYDAWRIGVLKRLGEVLKVRSEEVRTARRKAAQQADAAAKVKRDQQFQAWADGEDSAGYEQTSTEAEYSFRVRQIPTMLTQLEESKRVIVLHCLLLLFLSLEHYSAHSRLMLQYVAKSLILPDTVLAEHEASVARGLLDSAATHMSAEEAKQKQANEGAVSRRWKVGLATVGGAVLIGVTGGLAAPILAGAVGSLMGGIGLGALATLLGPLATNFFLIGGLFGAYGGKMTGGIVESYAKEVEDFKFIPITSSTPAQSPDHQSSNRFPIPQQEIDQAKRKHQLRVTIGISGFLGSESDVFAPWNVLNSATTEAFALRYEQAALLRLGSKLDSLIASYAVETLTWEVLRRTLLNSIAIGLWPIGLIRAANALDSPWGIAQARSEKAGKVLAQALMDKVQGERPVSLIGYSLGARVIWSCLQSLAEHNAFGLVEQVILMGAPVPADEADWIKVRAVVVGRVVNAYSENDWILGLVYRAGALQWGVAGLQKIKGVEGVENIDLGGAVNGHTSYRDIVGQTLQRLRFEDIDHAEVQREVETLRAKKRASQRQEATGAKKKKVDVDTMVKAQQNEQGIILMADNTKPLLDIEGEEEHTPEWLRADRPTASRSGSNQSRPSVNSRPSNDLLSLLDMDNDESPPAMPSRPSLPTPQQSLPTRTRSNQDIMASLLDFDDHKSPSNVSKYPVEQKVLLPMEPKFAILLTPQRATPSQMSPPISTASPSVGSGLHTPQETPQALTPSSSSVVQSRSASVAGPTVAAGAAGALAGAASVGALANHERDDISEEINISNYDTDSEDDEDRELDMVAPEPVADEDDLYAAPEPQTERVTLGEPGNGIDMTWDDW